MNRLLLIVLLSVGGVWGLTALYAVDQAEYAFVTQFGLPVATVDGGTDAGLHVKWPWPIQSVQRLDRRLQVFDLPTIESLTRDRLNRTVDKTLAVDAYVCWRIADAQGVQQFIQTVGSIERANRILGQRISSQLGAVMSNLSLDELIAVSADPAEVDRRMESIRQQLFAEPDALPPELRSVVGEPLRQLARNAYGIEIVDIRLRRFNYPEQVRASITERIRSERAKKVAEYESQGRKLAAEISSQAELDAKLIEARALAEAQRLREQADAEAERIRNEAHQKDPEFYVFLQKLRSFRAMMADSRDLILLSTRHPLFDILRQAGPTLNKQTEPPGGSPAPAPAPVPAPKQGGPLP
jgi:membrane protease subunit HflC